MQAGFCALCREERALQESHIIPEFLYEPGYDRKHRLLEIRSDIPRVRLVQKGIREPLLCTKCEGFLNENYERPMSAIWRHLIPGAIPRRHTVLALLGFDYATFKLFHLSILWRASVARSRAWELLSLGERHESSIRTMILNRDPGPPGRYPMVGNVMLAPRTRRVAFGTVQTPGGGRFGGARVWVFIYGGCSWHFVVANHLVAVHPDRVPSPKGAMVLGVRDLTTHEAFDSQMRAHIAGRSRTGKR